VAGTGPVHRTFNFGLGPPPQSSSHCRDSLFGSGGEINACSGGLAGIWVQDDYLDPSGAHETDGLVVGGIGRIADTTRGMPNWMMAPVHMKQGWSVVYIVVLWRLRMRPASRRAAIFAVQDRVLFLDEGIVAGASYFAGLVID